MTGPSPAPAILIATFLEAEYVERIAASSPGPVLYAPELLPRPRYLNDHSGVPPRLSAADEQRWADLVARAEISFDTDWRAPRDLLTNAPNLRWVQATSAGIGGFLQRHGLDRGPVTFTTAAGTHVRPLTEFAVAGVLYFVKDVRGLQASQRAHHWERQVSGQLAGRRATVIGLGSIGRQIVRTFELLGVTVTGVGRAGGQYEVPDGVTVVPVDQLDRVLPATDVLVVACPLTPETVNLVNAERVGLLPAGAIVVNVGRGPVIDEAALTASLVSGHLGGAALDVFAEEPLPDSSPLWDLPNVLISPHSASTAPNENAVIVELFLDNLGRYLDGRPLLNIYVPERGY